MERNITTLGELKRYMRQPSIRYVFIAHVGLNREDLLYVEASKASILRAIKGQDGATQCLAEIRHSESDSIYIG